jgi:hypothetical protein
MRLKMEVRKLRKQVHKMQKRMKKYKQQARKSKAIGVEAETQMDQVAITSAATQTDPVERLFEDREYALMVEVQTWKSTVAQYQNEVRRTQERASTTIFEYVERIDIMRLRHAKQQLKMEQLEKQVAELKTDKEQMFNLVQEVMACRPPASCYSLFLHERFLLFCMESIKNEISYKIEDGVQFLRIMRHHDVPTQHLMCEFYLHGYLLRLDREFNPVPYVGDIHLRALTSYTFNQISWQKAFNTFESNQVTKPFIVRGEHERSVTMFTKHNTFLGIEGNRDRMLRTQNWCLDLCVKQLVTFQDEALDCCQKRWMMSPTAVRNREPFGAPNFARVLPRVPRYVACVRTCGVRWMGIRFQFPTIWLPVENYTPAYMSRKIGGKKSSFQMVLKFQGQRWPKNMISPIFRKPTVSEIQTCGGGELHEGMQKASWGEMLGTKSGYLSAAFPLPFLTFLHLFTYVYYAKPVR